MNKCNFFKFSNLYFGAAIIIIITSLWGQKPSYTTGRTVETTRIEFYVTDFQSISMIESNLLPSKNSCQECK